MINKITNALAGMFPEYFPSSPTLQWQPASLRTQLSDAAEWTIE